MCQPKTGHLQARLTKKYVKVTLKRKRPLSKVRIYEHNSLFKKSGVLQYLLE
jgi:hypothetical protein